MDDGVVRFPTKGWPYTRRSDGIIAVTLDNNVWDFLFERKIDLVSQLPLKKFAVFIPREVEIEIPNDQSKAALRKYINQTIAQCAIQTTYVFGFAIPKLIPQRLGGLDQGAFQSETEREFYAAISARFLLGKSEKGSGLAGNEGDAAVAAHSFSSVVLTCEKRTKPGPLRFAAEHGGKILYLRDVDQSKPLAEHIRTYHLAK